ncbi:TRAP transporter large permease [Bradyrhizobium australiense]|uniref:TRAP transporter large permease protein n=1 Tax=Bradyrhizobium australiense TaxID=2721161 RepID=A0A7Y4LV60_9BRAD|nr:TRAP transporter large permease [Bradyrhizobium australiense]NOJ39704.1 TRAP transporter large permease [Bradyrhizobium australiense]
MGFLFLFLGYMGVPVAFALIASVLVVTAFTPVSLASMMAQLFNGMDTEALLAVPFFLLVGDLMTSANVTVRMITLSQTLVGHLRGGLAQVVTIFSMFFAGISGSSAADVAILSRTLAPEMKREGYNLAFTAALIASASTMANLIPPSIMAVVYGATGNVSIGGLFLGGVAPGVFVGIGLMIYSHFFGPVGVKRKRATFGMFATATKQAAVPLMIPFIIMGGILTGQFTPTEAGIIAVAYIVFVAIPLLNRQHYRHLPRDMALTGLLYSIPLITIGAASVFGWMLAYLRGPAVVSGWISSAAGGDPFLIMLLLVALFVVVGDFIDAIPAIIIFMPIIDDLTKNADINPVHMGVVIIVTLAFGLITPPYGLALLMASKFVGVRFGRAMLASFPIYIVFFAAIAFCIFFPEIVLWLPKHLLPESVGCFKNPSGAGYICP